MNKSVTDFNDAIAGWNAALAAITPQVMEAIAEAREFWEVVREHILQCSVTLRRFQLFLRLRKPMPDSIAWWLAEHCPERWLPTLDTGFMLEAMRNERKTDE